MIDKAATIINKYLTVNLIGIVENKDDIVNKEKVDYSKIEIKPLAYLHNDFSEHFENIDNEIGNTIIGGCKLYGQELINNIGVINIKVYDQNKEFLTEIPFTVAVDLKSHSVALQELID